MDFGITAPTKEIETFGMEVREWIKKNIPDDMRMPMDTTHGIIGEEQAGDRAAEMMSFWNEKHLELGKKGWLYPAYPKQYGGGGLSGDHEAIIQEEFRKWGVLPHHSDRTTIDPILVWGTEEQKQKFVTPLLRGEKTCHQKLTEPQSGSDQATVRNRAVKDGDDWLITGQNVFISTFEGVDYLSGQAMTDPEAPRHRNTGFFIIPNPSPGLEIVPMTLVMRGVQKFVYMDNVRVPADHLIGGSTEGWQVMGTLLENEHGGGGRAPSEDHVVTGLVDYMQESKKKVDQTCGDPVVQGKTVDAWIDDHKKALFSTRNRSMFLNRQEMSWEGPTGALFNREQTIRTKARVRDVMGMYAQLDKYDPLAPYGGRQEFEQRERHTEHGAGSLNINKVVVARRIGISRTKERAAPTRMTAPSGVRAAS
jgi:alkylation response protein AidB-like acyl-CoA dehydrogenase